MTKTWVTRHTYVVTYALIFTLLAGGVGLAVVQRTDSEPDRVPALRTGESRSANDVLGSVKTFVPPEVPVVGEAQASGTSPQPAAPPPFTIDCPEAGVVQVQDGDSFTCKVSAQEGFSAPVTLACVKPPKGLDCTIEPRTVTPSSGGSTEFQVGLSNNSVKPGKNDFFIVGTSGSLSSRFVFPFNLKAPASSGGIQGYAVPTCGAVPAGVIAPGQSVTLVCEYAATPDFVGTVKLACLSASYVACGLNPEVVAPRYPVPSRVTVTLSASPQAEWGQTEFSIFGFGQGNQPRSVVTYRVVGPPPAAPTVIPDYTFVCPEAQLIVKAGSSRPNLCIANGGSFEGTLNVRASEPSPTGLRVSMGNPQLQIQPGETKISTVIIDATNAAPGLYAFTVSIRHDGADPGFISPYNQKILVQVLAADPAPAG